MLALTISRGVEKGQLLTAAMQLQDPAVQVHTALGQDDKYIVLFKKNHSEWLSTEQKQEIEMLQLMYNAHMVLRFIWRNI